MKRTKTPTPKTVNQINRAEILRMKSFIEIAIEELAPHHTDAPLTYAAITGICQEAASGADIPDPIQKADTYIWTWLCRAFAASVDNPRMAQMWDMINGITELSDGSIVGKAWENGRLKKFNLNRSN